MKAGRPAKAACVLLSAAFMWSGTSVPAFAQQRAASAADVESLKAEVQRLRSDVEVMKTHIGRIARYLDDRDRRNVQAPPPAPAPGLAKT